MSSESKRWKRYVRDSHVRNFGGLDLCIFPVEDPLYDEAVFDGLGAALRLIYKVQPWRARMLPRHIKRILSVYPLRAEYVRAIDACVIGHKLVIEGPTERVAETIIHEFTHARIENCGIEYTKATRERIEYLCRKAALNFGRAAVSAPRLTRGQVPHVDPWWTEEHRVQDIVDQLRELRAPEWLITAALAIYRTKRRFLRRKRDASGASRSEV